MSSTPSSDTFLDQAALRYSEDWGELAAARLRAAEQCNAIAGGLERLIPADTAFVVFGSLARQEWTSRSDLDWTLLVDGQAYESHLTTSQRIRETLDDLGYGRPGPTAVFGGPAFSHELVHRIGGDADSNQNTTRRILLFLESGVIGEQRSVRDRVIRQLLKRYIEDDHGYRADESRAAYVPGFLLNDLVRFWRTMAVDFAAKRRDRAGKGWALRRLKLRLSRKLIFVAGLIACMSCKLHPEGALATESETDKDFCSAMADFLFGFANLTPIEILARFLVSLDAPPVGRELLSAYDAFLGVLADEGSRSELEALSPDGARRSPLFRRADRIAADFREGLVNLFFKTDKRLAELTEHYGVF